MSSKAKAKAKPAGTAKASAKRKTKPVSGTDVAPKKNLNLALEHRARGNQARMDFVSDVAAASRLTCEETRKGLDGLRTVICRNLREKKYARIPNLVKS